MTGLPLQAWTGYGYYDVVVVSSLCEHDLLCVCLHQPARSR